MAFPTVRSFQETSFATTVTSWAMTNAPTVNSGDLLINGLAMDGPPVTTWDQSSFGTWTQLVDFNRAASTPTLVIFAKVADGTEDGGTLTPTTDVGERGMGFSIAIQDWDGNIAGVEVDPTDATGTGEPDSASLTPSWDDDTLWITVYAQDNSLATASVFPTNYADNQNTGGAGGGSGAAYGLASRELAASSEDPGAFTTGGGGGWCATTIGIRSVAAAGINTIIIVPTGPPLS